jgi:drug/metabolite transporter (DMT)-like permease
MKAALLLTLLSVSFMMGGEYMSKIWATHGGTPKLLAGMACYFCCTIIWFVAMSYHNHLTTLGTIWDMGALASTIVVGILIFKEPVTASQWCGLVLAFVASFLMCR